RAPSASTTSRPGRSSSASSLCSSAARAISTAASCSTPRASPCSRRSLNTPSQLSASGPRRWLLEQQIGGLCPADADAEREAGGGLRNGGRLGHGDPLALPRPRQAIAARLVGGGGAALSHRAAWQEDRQPAPALVVGEG